MVRTGLAAWAALAMLAAGAAVDAQPVRGTVLGQVTLADGTGAPGVEVTLEHTDGSSLAVTTTDDDGRFAIEDVRPGEYVLRAAAGSDLGAEAVVEVVAEVMPPLTMRLSALSEVIHVAARGGRPLDHASVTSSATTLRALPTPLATRALPRALAATPGWAEEDNGLLHVRGVDDGLLYVEDGVPVYDRVDVAFGLPPSLPGAGTVTITTGHTPAQFGLKSGAVVFVDSLPSPGRWVGETRAGSGSSDLASTSAAAGGPAARGVDLFASTVAERSSRFLDPVHPDNLHNTGGVAAGSLRLRARLPRSGQLTAVARLGRSLYDVPHGDAQDAAGQDQRQRIVQGGTSLAWQQAFASTALRAAAYVRRVDARLLPSSADTPLSASSDRRHDRQGVLASLSRAAGRHLLTAGGEAARLSLHEDFTFAVTDDDAGDLSDSALAFTAGRPFRFSDRVARWQWSAFAQDRFDAGPLALDLGLRYDRTALLVEASQWSPRLGAGLDLSGLAASMRLSFNRFFQPPQAEHLLLASSESARALSPFASAGDLESGGAAIEPERQSAWELGWEQRLPGALRLDVAAWHRRVENYADPNVFFGTTIVFPNSVARGTARGLDVRLTLPARNGWTASASYSLSKVEQKGPINGGLFLEDDIDELEDGVVFTPDHDQRHVAAATITWVPAVSRWSASAQARYASGTPLEVGELDDDDIEALLERPGADLIDIERGRVKPRLVVDLTASARLLRAGRAQLSLGASVLNAFNRRYAFNFGNPFSGTHFGAPRQFRVDLSASFR
ncbi:MAG: TonB-dependent receptor [Vicinamibacterales bacterium]